MQAQAKLKPQAQTRNRLSNQEKAAIRQVCLEKRHVALTNRDDAKIHHWDNIAAQWEFKRLFWERLMEKMK